MLCLSSLQGNGKLIFQGCISYVACILITYLGFAMLRFGNIEQKYARKLDGAARSVSPAAAGVVFTALCAGFESRVMFDKQVINTYLSSIVRPCVLGILNRQVAVQAVVTKSQGPASLETELASASPMHPLPACDGSSDHLKKS